MYMYKQSKEYLYRLIDSIVVGLGLEFWCLAPLSTIFQLYHPWQWVLLVEETRVPGENHRPAANHWQTLSHNVVL